MKERQGHFCLIFSIIPGRINNPHFHSHVQTSFIAKGEINFYYVDKLDDYLMERYLFAVSPKLSAEAGRH